MVLSYLNIQLKYFFKHLLHAYLLQILGEKTQLRTLIKEVQDEWLIQIITPTVYLSLVWFFCEKGKADFSKLLPWNHTYLDLLVYLSHSPICPSQS